MMALSSVTALFMQGAAALGSPAAVPPPVPQATAQCAQPVYASDHLVCADAELLAMDRRLAAALQNRQYDDQLLMEGDESWFRRRSRCAFEERHRACLIAAYAERVTLVNAVAHPLSTGLAAQCIGALPTPRVTLDFSMDGKLLVIRNEGTGATLGGALALADAADWKPFATFSRKGRQVRIRTYQGTAWRCNISQR